MMKIIFVCVFITIVTASRNHHHFIGLKTDTGLGHLKDNNGFHTIIHNEEITSTNGNGQHLTNSGDLSNALHPSYAHDSSADSISEVTADLNRLPEPVTDTPEVEMARQAHFEAYREAALMAAMAPDTDESSNSDSGENNFKLDQVDELQQNTRELLLNKQTTRNQLPDQSDRSRSSDLERISHDLGHQQQRQLITTYILTAKAEAHALSSTPHLSVGLLDRLDSGSNRRNLIRNGLGNDNGNGHGNRNGNGHSNGKENDNDNGISNEQNNGNGNGYGSGYGNGYSSGYSNGYGDGNGNGHGSNDGNGHANQNGNGNHNGLANEYRQGNENGHANGNRRGNGNGHANENRLRNGNTGGNGNGYGKRNGYGNGHENGNNGNGYDKRNGHDNGHGNDNNNDIHASGNGNGNGNADANGNGYGKGNGHGNIDTNERHVSGNGHNGNGNDHHTTNLYGNGINHGNGNGNYNNHGNNNMINKKSLLDESNSDTTYYTVDTPDTHYTVVIPPPATVLTTYPRIDSIRLGGNGRTLPLSKSFTYRTQRIKTGHS